MSNGKYTKQEKLFKTYNKKSVVAEHPYTLSFDKSYESTNNCISQQPSPLNRYDYRAHLSTPRNLSGYNLEAYKHGNFLKDYNVGKNGIHKYRTTEYIDPNAPVMITPNSTTGHPFTSVDPIVLPRPFDGRWKNGNQTLGSFVTSGINDNIVSDYDYLSGYNSGYIPDKISLDVSHIPNDTIEYPIEKPRNIKENFTMYNGSGSNNNASRKYTNTLFLSPNPLQVTDAKPINELINLNPYLVDKDVGRKFMPSYELNENIDVIDSYTTYNRDNYPRMNDETINNMQYAPGKAFNSLYSEPFNAYGIDMAQPKGELMEKNGIIYQQPINSNEKIVTIDNIDPHIPIVRENIYDPRSGGYGDNNRYYIDPMTGRIKYDYSDVDALQTNEYFSRSALDTFPGRIPIGFTPDKYRDTQIIASAYTTNPEADHAYRSKTSTPRDDRSFNILSKNFTRLQQRRIAPVSRNMTPVK